MAKTIHEVFYTYLRNNAELQGAFGLDRTKAKVFYLQNKDFKQPFGTIYLVDDEKVKGLLCNTKGGEARFQCDTFTRTFVKGVQYREVFEDAVKAFEGTTVNGITINWIEVGNEADRSDTINGLFQFSFEAIIHWES